MFKHLPGRKAVPAHVLMLDVEALKNPVAHTAHVGWVVTEPAVLVYLPGGHLVWAVQESGLVLLLDVETLKNPVGHTSHLGWAVPVA